MAEGARYNVLAGAKTHLYQHVTNRDPTVFVTMLNIFRPELGQQFIWALGWAGLSLVPPFVVYKLLAFAQDLSIYNRSEAMFYVTSLLVSIVLRGAGNGH